MLLRSTLIYLPALLLPRVATFVLVIAATRLLPISEYGLFALVITVGEIAEGVTTNWLRVALVRLSGAAATFPASLWRATARANQVTTALAVLVVAPAAFVLVPERWPAFWLAVAGYVGATSLLRFGLHVLQSTESRRLYATIEASRASAILAAPILAIVAVRPDFLAASLAGSAATALFGAWALAAARRRVAEDGRTMAASELTAFAAPMVTTTAVAFMVANVERLVLQVVTGAAAVGAYSAGYALARQPFEVLGSAVNVGGFPQLVGRYERDGEAGAREAVLVQLDLLLGLLLPAIAGVAALRHEIAAAILPAEYREVAAAVLPWVALGAAGIALRACVFDNVFHIQRRSWMLLVSLVPSALVSVGAAFALIPGHGAAGAAWAFAAGSLVSMVLSALGARRFVAPAPAARSLGKALLSAAAVAAVAHWAASSAPSAPAFVTLAVGLAAGGWAFLLSQVALRGRQVAAFVLRALPAGRAAR